MKISLLADSSQMVRLGQVRLGLVIYQQNISSIYQQNISRILVVYISRISSQVQKLLCIMYYIQRVDTPLRYRNCKQIDGFSQFMSVTSMPCMGRHAVNLVLKIAYLGYALHGSPCSYLPFRPQRVRYCCQKLRLQEKQMNL